MTTPQPSVTSEMVERFWSYVDRTDDGCWPWLGATAPNRGGQRYGHFRVGRKMRRANRFAYELTHGPIPDGMVVRHSCDNSVCCNPGHLVVGTQKQNVADCYERGRAFHHRGSKHPQAKLAEGRVIVIKNLLRKGGRTYREIGDMFGVSTFTIQEIAKGKRWRHVHD